MVRVGSGKSHGPCCQMHVSIRLRCSQICGVDSVGQALHCIPRTGYRGCPKRRYSWASDSTQNAGPRKPSVTPLEASCGSNIGASIGFGGDLIYNCNKGAPKLFRPYIRVFFGLEVPDRVNPHRTTQQATT